MRLVEEIGLKRYIPGLSMLHYRALFHKINVYMPYSTGKEWVVLAWQI
jgi:hypothetical protein